MDIRTKGPAHRAHQPDERDTERASEQAQLPRESALNFYITEAHSWGYLFLEASTSKQDPHLNANSEEGEEMDATNADDEAMMAAMGLASFGSTKVCHRLST